MSNSNRKPPTPPKSPFALVRKSYDVDVIQHKEPSSCGDVPVVRDAPMFRAMTMMTEPSAVLMEPSSYNNKTVHSTQALQSSSDYYQKPIFTVNQSSTTMVDNTNTWQQPVLTRLSPYHPLESCHRRLPRHTFHTVLDQLAVSFRLASLIVQFEDCPISALCESMDQCRFAVSVWEANDGNGDEIIVEIQRVYGDAIIFARYAKEIMTTLLQRLSNDARKSPSCSPSVTSPRTSTHHPFHSTPFPSVLSATAGLDSGCNDIMMMMMSNGEEEALSALEIAQCMLVSERYDARQLGLDSLVLLTDPWQTGNAVAKIVSQNILLGGSASADLQTILLSLALKRAWPILGESSTRCAVEPEPASEAHTYLALMALTRALQVLSETSESWLSSCLDQCRRVCHADLVSCMVDRVVQAASQPHEAFYATLALVALCKAQPSLTSRVPKPLIEQALMVGCCRHAALETASQELLLVLTLCRAY